MDRSSGLRRHLAPTPTDRVELGLVALMCGVLIQGNFRRHAPVTLTKVQFGRHPQVRRSKRWIEERMREGMPSRLDGNRRIFDLAECLEWLAEREKGTAHG